MDILRNITRLKCWKCNGTGKSEVPYISDEDLSSQTEMMRCPVCGGDGYIEIPYKR